MSDRIVDGRIRGYAKCGCGIKISWSIKFIKLAKNKVGEVEMNFGFTCQKCWEKGVGIPMEQLKQYDDQIEKYPELATL